MDFAVPTDRWSVGTAKEIEKKDKFIDLFRELKKIVECESDVYTNCNWCTWYNHQRIDSRTGGLGNERTSGDYPSDSIIENSQNTEKSPVDLRKLAVTQIPVKNHQLTLMWKTLMSENNCQYIGMEFGIEKYSKCIMKWGKIQTVKGIELPNQETKSELLEGRERKFWGLLEVDKSAAEISSEGKISGQPPPSTL